MNDLKKCHREREREREREKEKEREGDLRKHIKYHL
jgi:hypothetical protein